MKTTRTIAAALLDGLAWLMEWPSRGARKLAAVLRGGGQGEEKVGGTD